MTPGFNIFARPIQIPPEGPAPSRFRITLAGMMTEPWLLFGSWAAGGGVLVLLGFWQVGLWTSLIGAAADVFFQARLKRLWRLPDLDENAGIRQLIPIVATRFSLGVAGSILVVLFAHSPSTMATVLMLQGWSICVAMAQFSAVPRLFLIAITPPLTAAACALWPYLLGPTGPALVGSLLLLVAILAVIGRQVGQVWAAWGQSWTENAALIHDLRAARAAADAASDAKSIFLATMSHEVRTPLNGILGMAQIMALNPLAPDQRERVAIIQRSGETLLGTLNSVLDLARIEAGHLELIDGVIAPAELVKDSVSAFAASATLKGLQLEAVTGPETQQTYQGDPVRLRQIIDNLVGNAVKFTDTGAIRVSVSVHEDTLVFEVRDTGRGISEVDLGRVFRPFEQVDGTHQRSQDGSGLGLAICLELTKLMSGQLDAESTIGSGTRFRLLLPALRRDRPSSPVVQDAASRGNASFSVLVAEDNATNQKVIRSLLEHLGAEVMVVDDGEQALQQLRDQHFDLVLMDVQMPVMDGLSATRAIRAGRAGPSAANIVVIGVTGNAMDHQVKECLAAGMTSVVAKPIQLMTLVQAIERGLNTDAASELLED